MLTKRFASLTCASVVVLAVSVACGDDDDSPPDRGSGGQAGSRAGSSSNAGSTTKAVTAGSAGTAGLGGYAGSTPTPSTGGAGAAGEGAGGAGGDVSAAGAAGEGALGGQGGGSDGGAAGSGGEGPSCDETRATLLRPIDRVSTGLVTLSSDTAGVISIVVDASAGYMDAANNPYIYLNLADHARVDVTDVQADASTAWDLALKRDNIRSNGGDSGPGNARVAALVGADFDATTAAAATGATFTQDTFVDAASCDPIVDATGKPLTAFDGWYDYTPATMTLTPAARVYLVRAANGTSLYKLKLTAYYVDVPDGLGGTTKKSAVYSLKYQAL